MKKARPGGWSVCARITAAILMLLAAGALRPARADLRAMSASQMADITGTGFSNFAIDGDTVRADFDIAARTYTEIESLKMGYWDKGGGLGWDQDWTGVAMGGEAQDMSLRGFFIEATFANLADPVNRKLTGVFFGFRQASGDLTADFNSLSRIGVADGDAGDERAALGLRTFSFNSSEFCFAFQLEGEHRGIWVRFGEGTTRQ